MFSEKMDEISNFIEISMQYYPIALKWLAALWVFNIINWKTGSKLNYFGIYPRHPIGLIGIIFSPFLHANFTHLLFNSIPLFFLSIFMMTFSVPVFYEATVIITLLSGFAVWCVGRKGIHIGASGVISGYFAFLLGMAYQVPSVATFFCAGLAVYYFGGILLSLFPGEAKMSWEGHLTGFLSGIAALFICLYYPLPNFL